MFKKKTDESLNEITINRKRYYLDISDKNILKRDVDAKIIDIASFNEIDFIKKLKKSIKSVPKEDIKKNVKVKYESGTIFKVGKSRIVYLFKLNGVYYGADLMMYQMFPKVLPIQSIEDKEIIDKCDKEKQTRILETLVLNNAAPLKTIKSLYDEIKVI